MSFAIRNTEFSGSYVVTLTSDSQKAQLVQDGVPASTVIRPLTPTTDVILTDALLLQARNGLWIDPSSMGGVQSNLALDDTADTAAAAAGYQRLFNLKAVNDSVMLTFPYTADATTGGPLIFTLLSGASNNFLRSQTFGGAYGNTVTLSATNTKAQTSFAQMQVRADNVTAGSEIVSFNVIKQGLA